MMGKFEAENKKDENGNPTGGSVHGTGLVIYWQDGPLGRGEDRKEPNGAFTETVIAAVVQRIKFYQDSKFACPENADAVWYLECALNSLDRRTKSREAQAVEGTHEVHA